MRPRFPILRWLVNRFRTRWALQRLLQEQMNIIFALEDALVMTSQMARNNKRTGIQNMAVLLAHMGGEASIDVELADSIYAMDDVEIESKKGDGTIELKLVLPAGDTTEELDEPNGEFDEGELP